MSKIDNTPQFKDRLLTTREVAELLAISERKLWEMTKLDEIPHVRMGYCVRYIPSELQAWMKRESKGGVTQ